MAGNENPKTFGELPPSRWPGERLGLPDTGRGSVGRVGRRILALFLDWGIAALIVTFLFPVSLSQGETTDSPTSPLFTLYTSLIFGLLQIVFIPTIGGSLGHRIFGMRVLAINGSWVGIWRPIVRTLLLLLVIPVLVWDSDQRGFHDKIAGTVLVRTS